MKVSINYLVAQVWEKVHAGQDITSSIKQLEEVSREEAQKVREEINDFIYAETD